MPSSVCYPISPWSLAQRLIIYIMRLAWNPLFKLHCSTATPQCPALTPRSVSTSAHPWGGTRSFWRSQSCRPRWRPRWLGTAGPSRLAAAARPSRSRRRRRSRSWRAGWRGGGSPGVSRCSRAGGRSSCSSSRRRRRPGRGSTRLRRSGGGPSCSNSWTTVSAEAMGATK